MGFFDNISKSIEDGKKKLAELKIEDIEESVSRIAEEASTSIEEVKEKISSITSDDVANFAEQLKTTASDYVDESSRKLAEFQDSAAERYMEVSKTVEEIRTDSSQKFDEFSALASLKLTEIKKETITKGGELYDKASEITVDDILNTGMRASKLVSGIQAYQDRKNANATMDEANKLKAEIEAENEKRRYHSNLVISDFGKVRLEALKSTIGVFVDYMKRIQKNLKDKDYEITAELDIKPEEIKEMETVEMNASDALKTTLAVGAVASAALTGVPAAVTAGVTALATASTGTAISSLSGAAASNAVLAWLGGGSIAAGGGGIAAGTTVLAGLTVAGTGIFALAAAGVIAGAHYSKKYTEATEYLAQIQEYKSKMELAWTALDGVNKRAEELKNLTLELKIKIEFQLVKLEKIIDSFDKENNEHMLLLQQTTLLVKSMSEMSQIPLLDDTGNVSEASAIIKSKVEKVLNNKL